MTTVPTSGARPTLLGRGAHGRRLARDRVSRAERVPPGPAGDQATGRERHGGTGYARRRSTRGTEPDRTGSIAFIVCEGGARVFSDPFFARVLWGASRELAPVGMQLVLLMVHSPQDYQSAAARATCGTATSTAHCWSACTGGIPSTWTACPCR
ncbi:hypothetical protein GCM10018954_038420 [Kutzneria kofuensis]